MPADAKTVTQTAMWLAILTANGAQWTLGVVSGSGTVERTLV
jgi:hypothetical protein